MLQKLQDAKDPLKMASTLDAVLAGLMLISFIISAITLGKNLRTAPVSKVNEEWKIRNWMQNNDFKVKLKRDLAINRVALNSHWLAIISFHL